MATAVVFNCGNCGVQFGTDIKEQQQTGLCTPCLVAEYNKLHDRFLGPDKFGAVVWSDEDIVTKLEEHGIEASQENIGKVRSSYECRHIDDAMVERGWYNIEDAVSSL